MLNTKDLLPVNMDKNRIPEDVRHVHLIAACGTGMAALAGILKDLGCLVTGSDLSVYPPMSDFLEGLGIRVTQGFDAASLRPEPDLVVVGNAVSRGNPEAEEMIRKGLFFASMPQALNHFAGKGKNTLIITGTHGKTTTASLLAWTLYSSGKDPSFFIGGILKDFSANYRLGKGPFLVVEGDEYDTAFFDKGPKFMHFQPKAAVVTGIEFDHADIYRDIEHIQSAFSAFLHRLPDNCHLFFHDKDAHLPGLAEGIQVKPLTYGESREADYRISRIRPISENGRHFTVFDLDTPDNRIRDLKVSLMGRHNLLNAASVFAVASAVGISRDAIRKAFRSFSGVRRRQEIRGEKNGVIVMDDFAHHPTAVQETIAAVRPHYPDHRLIAIFEPRTNTSMRRVFQDVYPGCFDLADLVLIRKPSRLDKVREEERFSSEKLVADIQERGTPAFHFPDTEAIIDYLAENTREKDILLIMSNGGFDNIHARVLEAL